MIESTIVDDLDQFRVQPRETREVAVFNLRYSSVMVDLGKINLLDLT